MKCGIALIIASIVFPGCMDFKKVKASGVEQGQVDAPIPSFPASEIGFADVQRYVFTPSCVRCHSGAKPAGDINLTDYSALMADPDAVHPGNPQGSSLFTEIATGSMPKGAAPLSDSRVNLVYSWIKAGAVEVPRTSPEPTPTPNPSPVATPSPTPLPTLPNFSDIQKYVIAPSCIKCHSGSKPSGKIDFSTYATTMAKAKVVIPGNPQGSSLYTEIATGSMPKKRAHLSIELTTLVYDWIKAGAPEK